MISKPPLNITYVIAAQHSVQNHVFYLIGHEKKKKKKEKQGWEGQESADLSQSFPFPIRDPEKS